MLEFISNEIMRYLKLTDREIEILNLVISGEASNKAIATKLGISPSTVGKHFESLFRKSGQNSKADLISTITRAIVKALPEASPDNQPLLSSKPKIAIVDDDEDVVEHINSMLQSVGFSAEAVAPNQTIERSLEFEVILLDFVLPEKDGVALAQEIAKNANSNPSVILITGYPDKFESLSENSDLFSVLYKPLELPRVVEETWKAVVSHRIQKSIRSYFQPR